MERIEHVTAWIHREGSGYVALCPELDAASQGDTIEEARRNLEEAVALFFESASDGEIEERFQRELYITPLDVAVG
jgi:predicted RNase H-like HicB family nuclease